MYTCLLLVSLHKTFHLPNPTGSLISAIKPEDELGFPGISDRK
jgi:hypothetical protein